jgi:ribonuclease D
MKIFKRNGGMGQEKCGDPAVTAIPPPSRMITDGRRLDSALKPFWKSRQAALDIEADSLYHYREKVCLIQLAAPDYQLVVDPLALDDFGPLKQLLGSSKVEKIVHGGDFDIRSLFRDFEITVNNLFDTEVASRFLGQRQTGLNAVVKEHFDIELNKKYQKKDWSQRPLPHEMIQYAVSDTIFLIPLAEILKRELTQKNRLDWVREECQRLSRVRSEVDRTTPLFHKFKGAGKLAPRHLAVLENLLQWRDATARKRDRPLFKIMGHQAVLKLALTAPRNPAQLKDSGVLSPKQTKMYGDHLLARINDAFQLPEHELPVYPRIRGHRPGGAVFRRMKQLRKWRDRRAAQLGLDPSVVITKAQMTAVAEQRPTCWTELEEIDIVKNWQRQAFGQEIIDTIA